MNELAVSVDASASTDPDGTITGYAWDFGDGGSGTGVTASHSYAAAGSYTITLTVTDDAGATASSSGSVTVAEGNVPPSASFTNSVNELAVSVDASASTDPDGTITGYAWDFGDGGSGTGVTASHSYAAAGSYTITLTVTDDAGATASSSGSVTVAAGNVPPSASFTSSVNELAVSVDASASADPDGTIAGYAWDFGDGGSGTGVTASHSYAAAGSYTITLTVTDDAGATASSSESVTVAEANGALLAQDAFARSETAGWGSADIGGEWSVDGSPSVYFVTGGSGVMSLTPGKGPATFLPAISTTSSNSLVTVSLDKIGNGGGTYLGVSGRRVGAAEYRGKVKVSANGSLALRLTRHSGTSETTLAQTSPGITLTAGQRLSLRVEVTGVSPTTVRARTWLQGTPEPGNWNLTVTDNTAGLQTPGQSGCFRTCRDRQATTRYWHGLTILRCHRVEPDPRSPQGRDTSKKSSSIAERIIVMSLTLRFLRRHHRRAPRTSSLLDPSRPSAGGTSRWPALAFSVVLAAATALAAAPAASADSAPADPTDPASPVTVTADSLPTVQIDGVVWQQTIIGDTVYAVGKFATARPAGAAPGSQTTPRNNIVAFSLSTGKLVTGFAPSLNAQALAVTRSPDGKRLYVGGDFTSVDGTAVKRVVALDPKTGADHPGVGAGNVIDGQGHFRNE